MYSHCVYLKVKLNCCPKPKCCLLVIINSHVMYCQISKAFLVSRICIPCDSNFLQFLS